MRVIAGEARGLPLSSPSPSVRPTMDRVRGAIFSSLGDAVPGARVLDLFAGSGALGIEALSRGAASVIFVDSNPRCAACVRENLRRGRLKGSVQVMDALKFLELYAAGGFDLIFADPPYAKSSADRDLATELVRLPALCSALRPGGTLVLERLAGSKEPEAGALLLVRVRRYGESEIAYYILAEQTK
ncbi:MAG TPA: 16S rRNA (guanine(966)-N(2))-methyltransferase RsmD [Terrimicrobiaceae bacterium]